MVTTRRSGSGQRNPKPPQHLVCQQCGRLFAAWRRARFCTKGCRARHDYLARKKQGQQPTGPA